ncbi:MAG TPA: hypothetical protein VJT31_21820 [Rugosimonospora sp.]|nr:hypothetical protein [Rugosimonospora sp.]
MGTPDESSRRATVAELFRIAAQHASGRRAGVTREQALAELAAASTDPDLLAEAAAAHAMAEDWYAVNAVDLLLDAGADPARMQRYAGLFGPTRIEEPPPA